MPGVWIALDHPRLPLRGNYVVMDIDPGYGRGKVKITAQAPAGSAPAVMVIWPSGAFEPIATEYRLELGGDVVALILTDETGTPLPGAKIWIDGRDPIVADAAATVRFAATPGRHVVRVEADGRAAVTTEITLRPASIPCPARKFGLPFRSRCRRHRRPPAGRVDDKPKRPALLGDRVDRALTRLGGKRIAAGLATAPEG